MKIEKAKRILDDPERFAHHERIFLNNPVVMQGMGLAPLVIVATSGQNALILCLAVALLLTPSRLVCSYLLRRVTDPLLRGMGYCGAAALLYYVVYQVLNALYGTLLLPLGIYLPMLVVEPLIIYRFGRVPEPPRKAVYKGVRITVGYGLILLVLGMLREVLAAGTVFGFTVSQKAVLPVASLPAGGFILLGVVCAVWRACVNFYLDYAQNEAKQQVAATEARKQ